MPFRTLSRFKKWRLCACLLLTLTSLSAQVGREIKHWSYEPVRKVTPPKISTTDWAANPVDAFILKNLQKQKLSPNPPADRLALLRRAYYDLTGLPPSQEQVEAFLLDDSPRAWERLIDQLLDSPHYGEKWGRHWLDVVRWAESNGYERDADKRNMWKYRDYVINTINEDKPYDEFIIDQIAGDVRPDSTPESIVATGFLRLGLYDDEPADLELFYFDYYDDIINTVSRSMLATSMACARCHDHKIDPLSQKEYYQFLAYFRNLKIPARIRNQDIATVSVFNPDKEADLNKRLDESVDKITIPRLKQWHAANHLWASQTQSHDQATRYPTDMHFSFATEEWHDAYPYLDTIDFLYQGELSDGPVELVSDLTNINPAKSTASAYVINGRFEQPAEGSLTFRVTINGGGWMYLGEELVFSKVGLNQISEDFSVTLPAGTHDLKIIASRKSDLNLQISLQDEGESIPWITSTSYRKLKSKIGTLIRDKSIRDNPWQQMFIENRKQESLALEAFKPIEEELRSSLVTAAFNSDDQKPTQVLFRGNPHAPGEEVQPGLPSMLGSASTRPDLEEDRRLILAQWIASKENPLTSRVAVNRIWQHHFGRGLVRSSDEFGGLGNDPTHPELLDWLADTFVQGGWKMKPLHKLIMTSKTYQMSSAPNDKALALDPQNDHFWRFDMRRLTAEEIRDSILMVTDHFNPQIGGPSVFPRLPEEVLATASRPENRWNLEAGPEHQNRRSIYTFTRRSLLDPMLSTFDSADTDTSCPVRFNTTVPGQALTMMNSSFVAEHAQRLAQKLKDLGDKNTEGCVKMGFQTVLGRQPDESELKISMDLIHSMQQDFGHDLPTAIERFALMMLNLNEFVFLD